MWKYINEASVGINFTETYSKLKWYNLPCEVFLNEETGEYKFFDKEAVKKNGIESTLKQLNKVK